MSGEPTPGASGPGTVKENGAGRVDPTGARLAHDLVAAVQGVDNPDPAAATNGGPAREGRRFTQPEGRSPRLQAAALRLDASYKRRVESDSAFRTARLGANQLGHEGLELVADTVQGALKHKGKVITGVSTAGVAATELMVDGAWPATVAAGKAIGAGVVAEGPGALAAVGGFIWNPITASIVGVPAGLYLGEAAIARLRYNGANFFLKIRAGLMLLEERRKKPKGVTAENVGQVAEDLGPDKIDAIFARIDYNRDMAKNWGYIRGAMKSVGGPKRMQRKWTEFMAEKERIKASKPKPETKATQRPVQPPAA